LNNKKGRGIGVYLIVLLILVATIGALTQNINTGATYTYYDIIDMFERGQVSEFLANGTTLTMTLRDGTEVSFELPSQEMFLTDVGDVIRAQIDAGTLKGDIQEPQVSILASMLPYIIILVIMGAFWVFMINRQEGGARNTMNFGKSRAKIDRKSVV
jgi:cell division protease FtsH